MRHITRCVVAILTILGLHTTVAQAQNQPTLHHANSLDLLAPSVETGPETDGKWFP
jgi:hypothetical protein